MKLKSPSDVWMTHLRRVKQVDGIDNAHIFDAVSNPVEDFHRTRPPSVDCGAIGRTSIDPRTDRPD